MSSDTHAHDHEHHDHAHAPHPHQPDEEDGLGYWQVMEIAVRELLLEKGVFTPEDVRRTVEAMDARSPALGARVVAKAWVDPAFKARLLADGTAACEALGIEMGPTKLVALENTATLHNLVVCTLCSCYPRMLLGLPPDWYKSRNYRSRAVKEPRSVLAEFGFVGRQSEKLVVVENTPSVHNMVVCTLCSCYPWAVLGLPPVWYKSAPYRARAVIDPRGVLKELGVTLPESTEVRVWDSTAEIRYMVLPQRPAGTERLSEDELAALVTRDAMIGVARVQA